MFGFTRVLGLNSLEFIWIGLLIFMCQWCDAFSSVNLSSCPFGAFLRAIVWEGQVPACGAFSPLGFLIFRFCCEPTSPAILRNGLLIFVSVVRSSFPLQLFKLPLWRVPPRHGLIRPDASIWRTFATNTAAIAESEGLVSESFSR